MGNMRQFDALQVPLEGNNLIEASAGTGKTYSIAVLALRMIIEKGSYSEADTYGYLYKCCSG